MIENISELNNKIIGSINNDLILINKNSQEYYNLFRDEEIKYLHKYNGSYFVVITNNHFKKIFNVYLVCSEKFEIYKLLCVIPNHFEIIQITSVFIIYKDYNCIYKIVFSTREIQLLEEKLIYCSVDDIFILYEPLERHTVIINSGKKEKIDDSPNFIVENEINIFIFNKMNLLAYNKKFGCIDFTLDLSNYSIKKVITNDKQIVIVCRDGLYDKIIIIENGKIISEYKINSIVNAIAAKDNEIYYVVDNSIMMINIKNGLAEVIIEKETARYNGTVNVVNYKSNNKIIESIFIEPQKNSYVLVVWLHGGPNLRIKNKFDYFFSNLVDLGFSIFAPNFSGSIGYGKDFEESIYKNWDLPYKEVIDGIDYIRKKRMDGNYKIIVCGESYGGYLSTLISCKNADFVNLCINLFGPTDLEFISNNIENEYRGYVSKIIGDNNNNPKLGAQSPINYVEKMHIPLYIVYSEDDIIVKKEMMEEFIEKLMFYDKDFEFLKLKNEGHGLSSINQLTVFNEILNFINKKLGE